MEDTDDLDSIRPGEIISGLALLRSNHAKLTSGSCGLQDGHKSTMVAALARCYLAQSIAL